MTYTEEQKRKETERCSFCEEPMEDHKRPCGNCGDDGHAKWECCLPEPVTPVEGKTVSIPICTVCSAIGGGHFVGCDGNNEGSVG